MTRFPPGFDPHTALELLAMSYAADLLGPRPAKAGEPAAPSGGGISRLRPSNDPKNPLPRDDGTLFPYPTAPIWPEGWGPAVAGKTDEPWAGSIFTSRLGDGTGPANSVNTAIFAHHAEEDVYALAFSGTENAISGIEDVAVSLISAGPVDLPFLCSDINYVGPSSWPEAALGGDQPPLHRPRIHAGFRFATEALTVGEGATPGNLLEAFESLGRDRIRLRITGHSMGGALACLTAAWLGADRIAGTDIEIEVVTFACPKVGNGAWAQEFDLAFTCKGRAWRVAHTLDTIPQLPPTLERLRDLNNPRIVTGSAGDTTASVLESLPGELGHLANAVESHLSSLGSAAHRTRVGDRSHPGRVETAEHLTFDYQHAGTPVILRGEPPVVFDGGGYPAWLFPGDPNHRSPMTTLEKQWWQHWPFQYARYLRREMGYREMEKGNP